MRFSTKQHPFYCGIDLHARTMSVCLLTQDGAMVVHRHMQASPDTWLKTIAPSRDEMVMAVACVFTWSWLADLCARAGLPCGLVVGDDTPCGSRAASIPVGRLPLPATPPPAAPVLPRSPASRPG